jgi:hypothetical protein
MKSQFNEWVKNCFVFSKDFQKAEVMSENNEGLSEETASQLIAELKLVPRSGSRSIEILTKIGDEARQGRNNFCCITSIWEDSGRKTFSKLGAPWHETLVECLEGSEEEIKYAARAIGNLCFEHGESFLFNFNYSILLNYYRKESGAIRRNGNCSKITQDFDFNGKCCCSPKYRWSFGKSVCRQW